MVTVIHINPETRTIEEREVDGSLKGFQALVGGLIECVARFGTIECGNGEIWASEEGRIKQPPYFYWTFGPSGAGISEIFVGPGFIAGKADRSDIGDSPITVDAAKRLIRFLTTEEAREAWPLREAERRQQAERQQERIERETGRPFSLIFVECEFPG